MPNDCWNYLKITSHYNAVELQKLIDIEFESKEIEIIKKGIHGIYVKIWSPWYPDYEWLEKLVLTYPSCWIKNEWIEESGCTGIWIGFMNENKPNIQHFEWKDLSIEEENYCFNDKK